MLDFSKDILSQILSHLYSIKVSSLLVEGGSQLLQSFIDASLWDCARVEVNRSLLVGAGVPAPLIPVEKLVEKTLCGGNEILTFSK